MKKPYGYLTTGEFANICRVKKQTLFHYDQIGILSPEIMGDNGYRYYSYLQLDTFNAISMLKELDMPLAEIKRYLDNRNPDDFLQLLENHDRLADEKINELLWLKKFIADRIRTTKEGITARHGMIFLESHSEEYYIISEHRGGVDDPDIYASLGQHMTYKLDHSIYSSRAIGALIDTKEGPWKDSYRYSHFYTQVDPEDVTDSENLIRVPAHSRICICSTSGFKPIPAMLNQLLEYASAHNFKTTQYFYEDMLLDDMSNFEFDTYTLKISLPVI